MYACGQEVDVSWKCYSSVGSDNIFRWFAEHVLMPYDARSALHHRMPALKKLTTALDELDAQYLQIIHDDRDDTSDDDTPPLRSRDVTDPQGLCSIYQREQMSKVTGR